MLPSSWRRLAAPALLTAAIFGVRFGVKALVAPPQQNVPVQIAARQLRPAETAVVNFTAMAVQDEARQRAALASGVRPIGIAPLEADYEEPQVPFTAPLVRGPRDAVPQPKVPSPSPALSFQGLDDISDGSFSYIPPDTTGAVGLTRVLNTLNNNYRILVKSTGAVVSTVAQNTFWHSVNPSDGVFDPQAIYDRYQDRFIVAATAGGGTTSTSLLVGVSNSSDPGGTWTLARYGMDTGSIATANCTVAIPCWADYPTLGFNQTWIAVGLNMFRNSNNAYRESRVTAFDYAAFRSGTAPTINYFVVSDFTVRPVVTYSSTETTLYAPVHVSSSGTYRLNRITGTASAPVYTQGGLMAHSLLGSWASPGGDTLPQSPEPGTSLVQGIDAGDARIINAVFRNNEIWYAQTVSLPAGSPTHTAVQWVRLNTGGSDVDAGRVEDSTATSNNGGKWYAYPSIAVNAGGDALLGYSQFSSSQFPSAGYSVRLNGDAAGTMRDPIVAKSGIGFYYKTYGGGSNRWGDFSNTQVEPTDDSSFWTVQEYSKAQSGTGDGSGFWSTWWVQVVPTTGLPGAFSKVSPASGATGQTLSPTLSWGSSSGATSYEYCFDTTNDNACSGWTSVGINTSVGLSGLSTATTYYWHVRANNATGTTYSDGGATAFRSFTTGSLPGVFAKTSPANGASGQALNPTLSWGSSSGTTSYEYCIDTTNDNACSSWTSTGTNTSVGLSGLSSGTTYYWHVRANNGVGTTYSDGSSTAFRSFTTGVPPGAFIKTSPANGATGQSLAPTLSWGSSSSATSYEYCVDTTNDNACSGWTSVGTNTSVGLSSLSTGTTYYWHVRANNGIGTTYADGSATAFQNFTTGTPPAAFTKTSPANGATGQSLTPTLSWGSSSGATSYEYCVDTTNDNACSGWTSVGTNTSVGLSSLSTGTTYYWHVRANNTFGVTYSDGSATAFRNFTTGTPPAAFGKMSPANGATGQVLNPTLSWGSSIGVTSYEYCIDTTNDNACSSWTSAGTNTSVGLSSLSSGTTYYWHVRANNTFGITYSDGSTTAFRSFTTGTPPGAFSKTSPANGATGQSLTPTLSWGSSSGATSYEYCIDTTNDNACTGWTSTGTNTSVGLSSLSAGTTYYWHVRANNGIGTTYADGSATAFQSFTTGTPPGAFSKVAPANGATGQALNPTLSWGASTGVTSYEYCVDTTNDNACSGWTSVGTNTSIGLSSLSTGTTYYWHVRANNAFGTTYADGSATAFQSFTTGTPPGAFAKGAPANGATGQSLNPTLTWGTSSGATGYEYCIDTTNDNACSSWTSAGTSTNVGLSSLSAGTIYYWHVRANNGFGTTYSEGSATAFRNFTTGTPPGVFSKISPVNGATGQALNPTLSWGASSGAADYEYCIDTTNDNACSGWTSAGASTSVGLSALSTGTTYYWHVRANNAFGTAYSDGSTTAFQNFTTGTPPGAFSKISPANGATGQALSPTLSWGASTGVTSYEYCFDTTNDNACSSWTSAGTNTSAGLSGLSTGTTYYWHVRANNGVGTTYADGSATAFQSFTTGTAPGAFSKASPANGASGQSLTPTLSWGSSSGATSYEYCVDTTNDNACSSWTSAGTNTSVGLSGLSIGTTYYWHVRANNTFGITYSDGSTTAFRNFTTGAPPGAFSKVSPANGATGQSLTPTLSWGASSGVSSYEYCIDTTNDNACSGWTSAGTNTSVGLGSLSTATTYYWHVRANNGFGTTYADGSATAFRNFTTGTLPAAFSKTAPANGATGQALNTTLSWGSSTGATSYEYCFDTTDDNACPGWISIGTSTSVGPITLSAGTTYYWHVRSNNGIGTTYADGSATAFQSFTTGGPPGAFNKVSPANGATGQALNPTLSWGASSGATSYEYCVDTTNDNACSGWTGAGTNTSAGLSGLSTGTTYYWHVRANNGFGTTYSDGTATAFRSFATATAPGAFGKVSPANGATGQPANATLSWGASSGATNYEYCLDTTNDNACSAWTSAGTNTTAGLSGLSGGTTYYWHVRANNVIGTVYSDGSTTAFRSFTVQVAPPAAPAKTSPSSGGAGAAHIALLTWNASPDADSYEYRVDTVNDAACNTGWLPNATRTSVMIGVDPATTYYWQVRARNAAGTTEADGGSWWAFTSAAGGPVPPVHRTDFTGDGKADIIWQDPSSGAVLLWQMDGATYVSSSLLLSGGTQWRIVGTGDFTGDGKTDLLWQHPSTGALLLWEMDGPNYVSSILLTAGGTQWKVVAVADFTGDGKLDILWQHPTSGALLLWEMNGAAYASSAILTDGGTQWQIVGAADFTGDGKTDLLWQHPTTGALLLWEMNGPSYVSGTLVFPGGTLWQVVALGDYTGDGKVDVLWQHPSSGAVLLWQMDGMTYVNSTIVNSGGTLWKIKGPR